MQILARVWQLISSCESLSCWDRLWITRNERSHSDLLLALSKVLQRSSGESREMPSNLARMKHGAAQERTQRRQGSPGARDVFEQCNPHQGAREGPGQLCDLQHTREPNPRAALPFPRAEDGHSQGNSPSKITFSHLHWLSKALGVLKENFCFSQCTITISWFRRRCCMETVTFRLSAVNIFLSAMCPL